MPYDRIALIGLGLIASSMALAIRRAGLAGEITGTARTAETRAAALELGLCDAVFETAAEAVAGADLVVLAVPVGAMEAVAREIAPHLAPGSTVTDVGRKPLHRAHGHRQHHQVGAGDGLGRGGVDGVAQAQRQRLGPRLGGAGGAGDVVGQPRAPHRQRHRARDQAQPDQRHPAVKRHQRRPLNCAMACTTRRQAGSSPTVMRRQPGSP